MPITKQTLIALRPEIDAALAEIAKKHGISLKIGAGLYDVSGLTGTFKLEIAVLTEGGIALSKEAAHLLTNFKTLGLTEDHLKQVFRLGGESYTLHGYISRAREKPYSITRLSDGKNYIATSKMVKTALGIKDWETA